MVICKTNEAHSLMKEKFHNHTADIIKIYHTIVVGNFPNDHDCVKNYIMRHPKMRYKMMITDDPSQGKESITEYNVLKRWKVKNMMFNLIKITLHTGRTHQIRVTMASLSHPVVGDPLYHKKNSKHNVENLCLVSKELSFSHPIENYLPKSNIISPMATTVLTTATTSTTKINTTFLPLFFSIDYPKHMQDFMDFLDSKNEYKQDDDFDDDDFKI